ncbi:MAG: hypothetical protein JXM69_14685 [Anaerolineae bacterium]|nr:hypothetical protein [Anaerolineae bacterium]
MSLNKNTGQTRFVTFGSSSVAVVYHGSRAAWLVDFLYRHAPAEGDIAPHVTYRLEPGDWPGQLNLYREDTLLYAGEDEAILAELLLGETCRELAGWSCGGLLFHAGGLAWQNKGVMLPGPMSAGKTTFTAWLVGKGLDYLTDELVFVADSLSIIQTFTRPLNLKKPSRKVLQNLIDFDKYPNDILSSPHADLIAPTVLNPANRLSEPPLKLIIFPRYQPDSEGVWQPLSKAQTGLALMECLVNARNLPDHGFAKITHLAKSVPAYKAGYAHFEQLQAQVERILKGWSVTFLK